MPRREFTVIQENVTAFVAAAVVPENVHVSVVSVVAVVYCLTFAPLWYKRYTPFVTVPCAEVLHVFCVQPNTR